MDDTAETEPNPKVGAMIANIAQLMNEAEEMLRESTSHHAEDQIELLQLRYDGLQRHFESLQRHFADLCSSAGRTFSAGALRVDRTIRAHPYESLALALGTGLVCGVLMARRTQPT